MSYTILGRAIKSEYLALGTLLGTVGLFYSVSSGGKKEAPSAPGKSIVERAKEAVPINAGSSEEEQFIQKFIEEAETDPKH